jgi:hypothetical protein
MSARNLWPRSAVALVASGLLLSTVVATSLAADPEPLVIGRWVVEAEPGGAVWAFQPEGGLVITGPGELLSEGTWSPAIEEGAFDATVQVAASGQVLEVLGQASDDGSAVALYVAATEASKPDDWTPWPAESRLVGHPLGMSPSASPEASTPPLDCLRPAWIGEQVDWDRCDEGVTAP